MAIGGVFGVGGSTAISRLMGSAEGADAATSARIRDDIRRYWRGPTWINAAWMVWLGMRRLGYLEQAERLAAGVIGAVARSGLREYYDPRDGRGKGAKDFAWSALVTEMADPRPS